MSSREHLHKIAAETLGSFPQSALLADEAAAVVSVLMPLIGKPEQMRGVPEGSILIVLIQGGARALTWEDGHLHGNLRADQMPMKPDWVIERYGPLTLVWMP